MSLADNFSRGPSTGFVRNNYGRQAARQFQVSLGLVIILAVAAVAVSLSFWLDDHGAVILQMLSIR